MTSAWPGSRSATSTSRRPPRAPPRPSRSRPRVAGRADGDMAIDVDRTTTEAGAYPMVLVSYVIACQTYDDEATADLVKGYLSYVVSDRGPAGRGRRGRLGPARRRPAATRPSGIVDKIAAGLTPTCTRGAAVRAVIGAGPPHRSTEESPDPDDRHPDTARGGADPAARVAARATASSPGSPAAPALIILVALAGVAIFLTVEGCPGLDAAGATYAPATQLPRLRRAAGLRHAARRGHRAAHRGAARARRRAVHLALRAAPARQAARLRGRPARRRALAWSTACGAARFLGRTSARSTSGWTTTSAGSRSSRAAVADRPHASSPPASCWRS